PSGPFIHIGPACSAKMGQIIGRGLKNRKNFLKNQQKDRTPHGDCCLLVFSCAGKQQKAPEMRFGCTAGDQQTAPGGGK
ncbi:MAG: hypothetical protein II045_07410, partial [Oscillospiraceae bacterium]|nr:hypothetical protein [Oscillospiraceae bacterium]